MAENATETRARSASMIASPPRPDRAPPQPIFMAKTARRASAGSTRKVPKTPPSTPQKHLDVFANPAPGRDYVIEFVIPEFTCHCPLTGQPDFAQFTIEMIAADLCIELKSLKLYMWSYRDEGAFHEAVTNRILDDIVAATKPRRASVEGDFRVRGGIHTLVSVTYEKHRTRRPRQARRRQQRYVSDVVAADRDCDELLGAVERVDLRRL